MYNRDGYKGIAEAALDIEHRMQTEAPVLGKRDSKNSHDEESPAKKRHVSAREDEGKGGGGDDGWEGSEADIRYVLTELHSPPVSSVSDYIRSILVGLDCLKTLPSELLAIIAVYAHSRARFDTSVRDSTYKRMIASDDGSKLVPERPFVRGENPHTFHLVMIGQPLRCPTYHIGGAVWSDRMGFRLSGRLIGSIIRVDSVWNEKHLLTVHASVVEYRAACEHCRGRPCLLFSSVGSTDGSAVVHLRLPACPLKLTVTLHSSSNDTCVLLS